MCRCGLEQIKVGGKCMKRKGGGLWERERRGSWVKWKDGGERDGVSGRRMGPLGREDGMDGCRSGIL